MEGARSDKGKPSAITKRPLRQKSWNNFDEPFANSPEPHGNRADSLTNCVSESNQRVEIVDLKSTTCRNQSIGSEIQLGQSPGYNQNINRGAL
jgi:hypothetical protein